jgi:hypothetical protein
MGTKAKISNRHKIYYLGNDMFLRVFKERGVQPASWQKAFLTTKQLYNEIVNHYGIENAFTNYFTNNINLFNLFNEVETFKEFKLNLSKLKIDNEIRNYLDQSNAIKFSIDNHNELGGDTIYDYANSKLILIFY